MFSNPTDISNITGPISPYATRTVAMSGDKRW
jgi:hypothetical protein